MEQRPSFQHWQAGHAAQQEQDHPQQHEQDPAAQHVTTAGGAMAAFSFPSGAARQVEPQLPSGWVPRCEQIAQAPPAAPAEAGPSNVNAIQAPGTALMYPPGWLGLVATRLSAVNIEIAFDAKPWHATKLMIAAQGITVVLQKEAQGAQQLVELNNTADYNLLRQAVRAQQVPHLHELKIITDSMLPELHALVCDLATQLQYVSTYTCPFVQNASSLAALQKLTLKACILSEQQLWELCSLPKMRQVTLDHTIVRGQHQLNSNAVVLPRPTLEDVTQVPFEKGSMVYIVSSVSGGAAATALSLLTQNAARIACLPGEAGVFRFDSPSTAMRVLAQRMQGVETVTLSGSCSTEVLQQILGSLPSTVHSVRFEDVAGAGFEHAPGAGFENVPGADFTSLCCNMPVHVGKVAIINCCLSVINLLSALRDDCPPHMHQLLVVHSGLCEEDVKSFRNLVDAHKFQGLQVMVMANEAI